MTRPSVQSQDSLGRRRFVGQLTHGFRSFPIEFDAWAGPDHHLQIEVQPSEIETVLTLGSQGEPGSTMDKLTLTGDGPNGETFRSESIVVRGYSLCDREARLTVSAYKATIIVSCSPPAHRPCMALWLRGFKASGAPDVTTSLGVVSVRGSSETKGKDDVSGCISIVAGDDTDLEGWADRADDFLSFMNAGLSFAHGGRLQSARRDFLTCDRWEATYYQGSGFDRGLPPVHPLNLGPFIAALARRFESSEPFPDMLWTVTGWIGIDIPFDGARFLFSMTALEAAVEHILPDGRTTLMGKQDFKSIKSTLLDALSKHRLDSSSQEILSNKIKDLNKRPLSEKIKSIRDQLDLCRATFSDQRIAEITKVRNEIVHKGSSRNKETIWQGYLFVRDLISQIVFHEIGYAGPQESYSNGYRRTSREEQ